ncbi:E3 ubiquitin-protein ligase PUB24-like [Olea europaea var. sylvestris]|uniref:U-box domain-containing protein n=1 Tax=Olea europaea subsp. europaea TaxID=158383 RepID=A0A8S0PRL0_OLEEU|nr:E3 ubiquitin-protein ligase PUB24-like [Olea europaea var. sylvestris]CAA2956985.1 E3 ubiquitin- ligase PUB24-like [Olea europaea subsp. europaea]
MDENIEVPQYFLCPISLQIMKDPVTTVTGITYDRQTIEHWLSTAEDATCPATNQPLPRDSDLTPNHMLRRLIQAWCIANAKNGIDQIPTPKSPLHKSTVLNLIRKLKNPVMYVDSLKKMDELANEDEKNRKCMAKAGSAKAMVLFVLKCFKEGKTTGLEEALRILHLTWNSHTDENQQLVDNNLALSEALTWILKSTNIEVNVITKTQALVVLTKVIEAATRSFLERLNPDFVKEMVKILQSNKLKTSQQAVKSTLQILIQICPVGRNRMKIIEAGAVFVLVETELDQSLKSKKITELIFTLLAHLCSCADGRAQFLKHPAGIAMVSKRLLRVSNATDDGGLHIFASISRFSATNEVLVEMLRVGGVSKICMVIQADCADDLKKKAREILRLHSSVWRNSPCIQVYLLTRYAR